MDYHLVDSVSSFYNILFMIVHRDRAYCVQSGLMFGASIPHFSKLSASARSKIYIGK